MEVIRREKPVKGEPIPPADAKKKVEFELEPIPEEAPPMAPPPTIPELPEDERRIIFELEPLPDTTWLPSDTDYTTFPEYMIIDERAALIDIETTGTEPWNSRIICISAQDLTDAASPIQTWLDEDEAEILRQFFGWFEGGAFTEAVGYNISFDIRWLFVAAMRYRMKIPFFADLRLYDLMQTMKQVYQRYVFGFNKIGTLEEWSQYLFGVGKPMSVTELLDAWAKKEYDKIREYSANDVKLEHDLLSLIEFVLTE